MSAISLIALTVNKRISQVNVVYHCGDSDQMALPSVDFLNPFALLLFVLILSIVPLTFGSLIRTFLLFLIFLLYTQSSFHIVLYTEVFFHYLLGLFHLSCI